MMPLELTDQELTEVSGGFAPLIVAGTLVTSSGFKAFATSITVLGAMAEIATAFIESD